MNNALDFNGNSNYVDVALTCPNDPTSTGAITVEFWSHVTNNITDWVVFHMTHGQKYTDDIALCGTDITFKKIVWRYGTQNSSSNLGLIADFKESYYGTWVHVALTSAGSGSGGQSIYINGKQVAHSDKSEKPGKAFTRLLLGATLVEGQIPPGGNTPQLKMEDFYKGKMDSFRVWDHVRTEKQINRYKNAELIGDEPGLVACFNFNWGIQDHPSVWSLNDWQSMPNKRKHKILFSVDQQIVLNQSAEVTELNSSKLPTSMRDKFKSESSPLSNDVTVSVIDDGTTWKVVDGGTTYHVLKEDGALDVYNPQTRLFSVGNPIIKALDNGEMHTDLKEEIDGKSSSPLNATAKVSKLSIGKTWKIVDGNATYYVLKEGENLDVCKDEAPLFSFTHYVIKALDASELHQRVKDEIELDGVDLSSGYSVNTIEAGTKWEVEVTVGSIKYIIEIVDESLQMTGNRGRGSIGLSFEFVRDNSPELSNMFQSNETPLSESFTVSVVEDATAWKLTNGDTNYLLVKENGKKIIKVHKIPLFSVGNPIFKALDASKLHKDLQKEFQSQVLSLSDQATVSVIGSGKTWKVVDGSSQYLLLKEEENLSVYKDRMGTLKGYTVANFVASGVAKEGPVGAVYRLTKDGEQLFTASYVERTIQKADGWIEDAEPVFYAHRAPAPGMTPLYRLHKTVGSKKKYIITASRAERLRLDPRKNVNDPVAEGNWTYDGEIAYVSATQNGDARPLYRGYKSVQDDYVYSIDLGKLTTDEFAYHDVVCYVLDSLYVVLDGDPSYRLKAYQPKPIKFLDNGLSEQIWYVLKDGEKFLMAEDRGFSAARKIRERSTNRNISTDYVETSLVVKISEEIPKSMVYPHFQWRLESGRLVSRVTDMMLIPSEISTNIARSSYWGLSMKESIADPNDAWTFLPGKPLRNWTENRGTDCFWIKNQGKDRDLYTSRASTVMATELVEGYTLPGPPPSHSALPYNKYLPAVHVEENGEKITVHVLGTGTVSDWAMLRTKLIIENMMGALKEYIDYPDSHKPLNGVEVIVISQDDANEELDDASCIGFMYREANIGSTRGGATDHMCYVTEEMMWKEGVYHRETSDTTWRHFDQVVHEFAHVLDTRLGYIDGKETPIGSLPSTDPDSTDDISLETAKSHIQDQIDYIKRKNGDATEIFAISVQSWFDSLPKPNSFYFPSNRKQLKTYDKTRYDHIAKYFNVLNTWMPPIEFRDDPSLSTLQRQLHTTFTVWGNPFSDGSKHAWGEARLRVCAGDVLQISAVVKTPVRTQSSPHAPIPLQGTAHTAGPKCIANGLAYGALVGKITGQLPFVIGNSKSYIVLKDGFLYVSINDDINIMRDNTGKVEVTIQVTPPSETAEVTSTAPTT